MGDVNAKSGFLGAVYPLVNIPNKLLQMAIEIVDLPSYKMVDFSIANCKRLPDGTIRGEWITISLKGWHMFASNVRLRHRHTNLSLPVWEGS